MVSILQQIYAGGLAPICDAMPRVREYQEALQAHFRHYDALRKKLTRLDPALQREYLKLPEPMRQTFFVAVLAFYAIVVCLYVINITLPV